MAEAAESGALRLAEAAAAVMSAFEPLADSAREELFEFLIGRPPLAELFRAATARRRSTTSDAAASIDRSNESPIAPRVGVIALAARLRAAAVRQTSAEEATVDLLRNVSEELRSSHPDLFLEAVVERAKGRPLECRLKLRTAAADGSERRVLVAAEAKARAQVGPRDLRDFLDHDVAARADAAEAGYDAAITLFLSWASCRLTCAGEYEHEDRLVLQRAGEESATQALARRVTELASAVGAGRQTVATTQLERRLVDFLRVRWEKIQKSRRELTEELALTKSLVEPGDVNVQPERLRAVQGRRDAIVRELMTLAEESILVEGLVDMEAVRRSHRKGRPPKDAVPGPEAESL